MAEIEIISSQTCPFAQRTRMALIEKQIDFELREIDLQNKPRWFLNISPYGKVPVVRRGEDVVFESAVINEYLEEVFPEFPLLPRDPLDRAKARIWIDFANVRFVPHFYKVLLTQDAEGQACHREKILEAINHMEFAWLRNRSTGPYWLGEKLTLADLTLYPHLQRFCAIEYYRGFSIPEEANELRAWLAAMAALPSAKATRRPDDIYIRSWKKYADNSSTGTTAQDMRG